MDKIIIKQVGAQGPKGNDGVNGNDGKSAYEVAVANGFVGTESQWLASLKGIKGDTGDTGNNGNDGKSAYEIAVLNGFVGTESQWLLSLKGQDGLDGNDGTNGLNGSNGLSAYQVALNNGFVGTESQWLASLKGDAGTTDYNALSNKPDLSIYAQTSSVNTALSDKVDKVAGKGLSTEDYTTTEKNKLASLSNYSLPVATDTVLGGVKQGTGVTIAPDGTISTAGGGGGLTDFNDNKISTAPNATIPVVQLQAKGTETNIDVALTPKGNGSLTRDVADNTTTGGNKRGRNTVDLQGSRNSADKVALADESFLAGGSNNKLDYGAQNGFMGPGSGCYNNNYAGAVITGVNIINDGGPFTSVLTGNGGKVQGGDCSYSVIIAGYNPQITSNSNNCFIGNSFICSMTNYSQYSSIVNGRSITMDGSSYATVLGGQTITVLNANYSLSYGNTLETKAMYSFNFGNNNKVTPFGSFSFMAGGSSNTIDAQYGFARGCYAHTKGFIGASVNGGASSFTYASDGKSQTLTNILKGKATSNSTPVVLTSDMNTASTNNQIVFASGETKIIKGTVIISDVVNIDNQTECHVNVFATKKGSTLTIRRDSTTSTQYGSAAADGQQLIISVDATNSAISFSIQKTGGNAISAQFEFIVNDFTPV